MNKPKLIEIHNVTVQEIIDEYNRITRAERQGTPVKANPRVYKFVMRGHLKGMLQTIRQAHNGD